MVQRTLIRPPSSRLGPITEAERKEIMSRSPVAARYDEALDRESAYEILIGKEEAAAMLDAHIIAMPAMPPARRAVFRLSRQGQASLRQRAGRVPRQIRPTRS